MPDSGYAWLVLAAAFFLNVLHSAQFCVLGIFLVEFKDFFQTSASPITWIGALQMFIGNIMGLLIGPFLKKAGSRVVTIVGSITVMASCLLCSLFPNLHIVYVFYGVTSGVGFISLYMSGMVAVQQYFHRRRSLATGIFMTGLSVGTFLWPPLIRWLMDHYSWRGALLIEGAIVLNGAACGALFRPMKNNHLQVNTDAKSTLKVEKLDSISVICSMFSMEGIPFCLFLIGYFGLQMGHICMFAYTPMRGESLGFPKQGVSLLLSVIGITGLCCRPVMGWLGDRRRVNRTILFGGSAVLCGSISIVSTRLTTLPHLVALSAAFAVVSAGYIAIQGAVLVDIVGLQRLEISSGILICNLGLANLCLHSTAGFLMDATGSTNSPFIVFGSTQVLGGVILVSIPYIKQKLDRWCAERDIGGVAMCLDNATQCVEVEIIPEPKVNTEVQTHLLRQQSTEG